MWVRNSIRVVARAVRRAMDVVTGWYLRAIYSERLGRSFSVQSHLTVAERVMLYRLARGKTAICEIGSYLGASACCFGAAMRDSGLQGSSVFCIDTWQNDAMSEGNRDTHAEFLRNTADYAEHIVPIRGWSTEVVATVSDATKHLDVLFIDGDHSYEGAKADWDTYERFLRPGSIVIFHDCGWAEGVQRVIHEDAAPRMQTHDRLPNMWWGVLRA